jgi:hypothetical protein
MRVDRTAHNPVQMIVGIGARVTIAGSVGDCVSTRLQVIMCKTSIIRYMTSELLDPYYLSEGFFYCTFSHPATKTAGSATVEWSA